MPNEDLSHLPPDVQASIKAAREKAEKEKAEEARAERVQARKARVERAQTKRGGQGANRGNPPAPKARTSVQDPTFQERIEKKWAEGEARKKEREKAKTYVVQAGDSLSKIAKALLGDAARWPEIFELNKDQIKDPNLIHVGQELRLP